MSDFLTHLVQRALSPTAEVRPRFLSRFETAHSPAPMTDADFAGGEVPPPRAPAQTANQFEDAPKNSAVPTEQNFSPRSVSATPQTPRAANAPRAAAPVVEAAPAEIDLPAESPDSFSIAPPDSPRERAGEWLRGNQPSSPRTTALPAVATPLSAEKKSQANPHADRTTSSIPSSSARVDSVGDVRPSAESLLHPDATRAPVPAPSARKPLEIHATKSPAPRPAQSAAARAPAPRVAAAAPVAEASGPPPIHVTIGRIEVRAITPPAAPAARRPERPTPHLSLDDYLRSRNGGGA